LLAARVRSRGARDNGKPSLPGGKRETLTDRPHENGVRVWSEDGLAVVTPLVQVDAGNAQQFWAALASVCRDHSVIVADLSAQQDCDWHAMSALMMALRYTDVGGGELRVAAGPEVRQVLTDAGMDRLVTVFWSLAEAMSDSHPPLEPGLPGAESA
jgi:anti-anti-sigma regulatory factor